MADERETEEHTGGNKWGSPISEERQTELRALFERQKEWVAQPDATRAESAFNGVALSGADVFWLAEESGRNGTGWVPNLHLERANLGAAHLEGANLMGARLARANLTSVHLEGATLERARLEGAHLVGAHLEQANLELAHLERAWLLSAYLEGAWLNAVHLEGANLAGAHLEGTVLTRAHLKKATLDGAHLEGALLREVHLEGTSLRDVHLEGRTYDEANPDDAAVLKRANKRVGFEGRTFPARLSPADLRRAYFDRAANLTFATLGNKDFGCVRVADVRWGEVNLAVVDWGDNPILLDESATKERAARHKPARASREDRLNQFREATRANRQLATVLRAQGLNDEADHFAYRAQLLQRSVLRLRRRWGATFGSWLLDVVSGYGYKPMRSVITYVALILLFAALYLLNGQFAAPHLRWDEALVLSISSFHGRGFFTTGISLGDTLARLAAGEAIVGLLLEITFIATFTQRFFAR